MKSVDIRQFPQAEGVGFEQEQINLIIKISSGEADGLYFL